MESKMTSRTGAEILLDRYIEATIHESPLAFPELRKDIYEGLESVARDSLQEDENSALRLPEELNPRQFTAYKILERMGMIDLSTGFCCATEQGLEVYDFLKREGVYPV